MLNDFVPVPVFNEKTLEKMKKMERRRKRGLVVYYCKECNFATPEKLTLERHSRTHSGERPFASGTCDKKFTRKGNLTQHLLTVASWAIVGMHPPINPIRSRWIRPAPGPLWTHLLEVPLLEQKELDLGHDKTDLKSSGSAIILFYLAVCQPDHIYTRNVPCISFERSCIFNI